MYKLFTVNWSFSKLLSLQQSTAGCENESVNTCQTLSWPADCKTNYRLNIESMRLLTMDTIWILINLYVAIRCSQVLLYSLYYLSLWLRIKSFIHFHTFNIYLRNDNSLLKWKRLVSVFICKIPEVVLTSFVLLHLDVRISWVYCVVSIDDFYNVQRCLSLQ